MNSGIPGQAIAVGAVCGAVLFVVWWEAFDGRRLIEEHMWRKDIERCACELEAQRTQAWADELQEIEQAVAEARRLSEVAGLLGELAPTAADIEQLRFYNAEDWTVA